LNFCSKATWPDLPYGRLGNARGPAFSGEGVFRNFFDKIEAKSPIFVEKFGKWEDPRPVNPVMTGRE